MSLSDIYDKLEEAGISGRIFSVDFKKKDGTERHMKCKLAHHMKIGKVGKGPKYNPIDKGLVFVFDMDVYKEEDAKKSYRSINLEGVLKINGEVIA